MKKLVAVSLALGFLGSICLALPPASLPYGVGAKYGAMGGAAASIVDDITAAYYNPAGIVRSGNLELKIGAGTATESMNQIISVLGSATDPAKFLANNFTKSINCNGGLNAIIGLSIAKVGISVIPVGTLNLSKAANTIVGNAAADADYEGVLTFGNSFALPWAPIASIDVGANIKSVNAVSATSVGTALLGGFTSSDNVTQLSGVGFDVGVKANVDTIAVPFSVGIVMKDISETLKGKNQAITTTYDSSGNITGQTITETNAPDYTSPVTTTIGASTTIPVIGLKAAIDLDSVSGSGTSYSVTHMGIEYPLWAGFAHLRAGTISGGANNSIGLTTCGIGFNVGLGLNVAMTSDAKNSKNNETMIDFGFAF